MSAIEGSVTLEDVFAVVEAKRVPLAPELAGYLTLEIADGSDAGGGDVDPRTVFISEEGTVALVRPKSNPAVGDAETSVRTILAKLLDASGSATPALGVAAKRKTPSGMPALVEELEAALIPVNRAAGRRALARLAREVKRVTMGVGRNASTRAAAPLAGVPARPATRARPSTFEAEEVATAKRGHLPDAPPAASVEPAPPARPVPSLGFTPAPGAPAPTPFAPKAAVAAPALRPSAALPPPPTAAKPGVAPPPRRESSSAGVPIARSTARAKPTTRAKVDTPDKLLGDDEVESLLASFDVQAASEKEMSRDLKAIAGLDPTPGPPNASTLAELTKDVGRGLPKSLDGRPSDESVDELLASTADASGPSPAITPSPARVDDPVEALLAFADASESPSERPLPTPRMQPTPPDLAAPPPQQPPPYAPYGPPPNPLAPPSPLVPTAALGRPLAPDVPDFAREPAKNTTPAPPPVPSAPSNRHERARDPSSGRGIDVQAPPAEPRTRSRAGREPRAPKTTLALLTMMLLALLATAGAIYWKAPYVFTGGKGRRPAGSTPLPSASAAPTPAPACKVALALSDVPAGAEILLRVGQAPVDVERMPMKTRLEFVATAEGQQPRRAVVRADATWDEGPNGKPRIEVPIQLDPSKARPGTTDPWPAAEPGSEVGGKGAPGTVHVVSNVRGAEIWLLAGLGPEARIEQLRCDGDIDILIAGQPANVRKRLHVAEKDVQAATPDAQGVRVVTLSAKQAP